MHEGYLQWDQTIHVVIYIKEPSFLHLMEVRWNLESWDLECSKVQDVSHLPRPKTEGRNPDFVGKLWSRLHCVETMAHWNQNHSKCHKNREMLKSCRSPLNWGIPTWQWWCAMLDDHLAGPHPRPRRPISRIKRSRTSTTMSLLQMAWERASPLVRGWWQDGPPMGRGGGEPKISVRGAFRGLPSFWCKGGVDAGALYITRGVSSVEVKFGVTFLGLPQQGTVEWTFIGGWIGSWGASVSLEGRTCN